MHTQLPAPRNKCTLSPQAVSNKPSLRRHMQECTSFADSACAHFEPHCRWNASPAQRHTASRKAPAARAWAHLAPRLVILDLVLLRLLHHALDLVLAQAALVVGDRDFVLLACGAMAILSVTSARLLEGTAHFCSAHVSEIALPSCTMCSTQLLRRPLWLSTMATTLLPAHSNQSSYVDDQAVRGRDTACRCCAGRKCRLHCT